MSSSLAGVLQIVLLVAALAVCYKPLGDYIAGIFTSDKHLRPERAFYRMMGIDPSADQRWGTYARSMLAFSAVSVLFLYLIERIQHWLPYANGNVNVPPALAWNTAASFVTNTNWQNYSGESTMGYVTQMTGLAVQNFVSAAVGIVVVIALIRGFMRKKTDRLGNFWVDLTRVTFRLLLPFSVIGAIILMATGVIDNFTTTHLIHSLAGAQQTMVGGPVASQEVIKEMGNNGGGFFNANSAHPFENPNPFSNWFEIFLLLVIPFALPRTFGKMVGDNRQGYLLVVVMAVLWLAAVGGISFFEWQHAGTALQAAHGAMEGKEVRFGIPGLVPVRRVHDRHLDRSGELLPRLVHRLRRRHRPVRPHARRGRPRRRRRRPVRHADAGRAHRVPRRPDGRPDAGVHRQEDPAHRDEVGRGLHPGARRSRRSSAPRSRWGSRPRARRSSTPDRTA